MLKSLDGNSALTWLSHKCQSIFLFFQMKDERKRLSVKRKFILYAYYCYRCRKEFVPYARNEKKNHVFPKKCHRCHSPKWYIPIAYLEECFRCGFFWDRRSYKLGVRQCPQCRRRDFRREDWEKQINYKYLMQQEEKRKAKAAKQEAKIPEYDDLPKIRFRKKMKVQKEDDLLSRLKE